MKIKMYQNTNTGNNIIVTSTGRTTTLAYKVGTNQAKKTYSLTKAGDKAQLTEAFRKLLTLVKPNTKVEY